MIYTLMVALETHITNYVNKLRISAMKIDFLFRHFYKLRPIRSAHTTNTLRSITKGWPWHEKHKSILVNTLRPRQNGRYFADDICECIFLNEHVWILI